MKNIYLESERLIYKRVSAEHVTQAYVGWINDPEVNKYLETRGNYTLDLLEAYVNEQHTKETYFWAIHLKESNKHIGNIKIDPINLELNSGEYGILMGDRSNWGKGYAKEASLRIIKYCFDDLKLAKITLGVVEDNTNAVSLYKKIGFIIDTVIKGTKPYNNKISNSLRMSLGNNRAHKFILGTVQMGLNYGVNNTSGKVSLTESHKILEYAYDSGIKILDSAEAYGNAHDIIGGFHKKQPNKIFEVITKLPHQFDSSIKERVETYLGELHVNHLQALLFHSFDSYKKNINNFDALLDLQATQKIKRIGVSVYTNAEIKAVTLDDNVEIIQIPFNLLDNNALRGDVLAEAKAKGKIIHTRSAFLQGLFFKALNSEHRTVKGLFKELNQLAKTKSKSNISMSQLALNYCLQQQTIDNVLIGVDSKAQLIDNIKALNYEIAPEVIAEINTIKTNNLDLLNPSLWT